MRFTTKQMKAERRRAAKNAVAAAIRSRKITLTLIVVACLGIGYAAGFYTPMVVAFFNK